MAIMDSVFVFDTSRMPKIPNPSDDDIQDSKLLYYFPDYRPSNEKRWHLGLIEGLISFTSNYTKEDIEFIKSKLFTSAVLKWTDNVYIVAEVQQYGKSWMNNLYKSVLETTVKIFGLLYGDINTYLDTDEPDRLKQLKAIMNEFLSEYITQATSHSLHVLKDVNLCKSANVNAGASIDVKLFIDDLLREFDTISDLVLINNGDLVHTSLDLDDMLLLYSYMVRYGKFLQQSQDANIKGGTEDDTSQVHFMRFNDKYAVGPSIHLKQTYKLCGVHFKSLILLVTLPDQDDILVTVNGIREYVTNKTMGLAYLYDNLRENARRDVKCISINHTTKTIKGVGFNEIDAKSLSELTIIYGIHMLLNKFSKCSMAQYRDAQVGWVNSKVANNREIYHLDPDSRAGLTENQTRFNAFCKNHLAGIYLI
ncbi:bifunctional Vacuolar fusion protein Ccz1/CCZ1-INTU-HSP4 [Babesia duncani]|uniref:Bifunctional Vacuolar fusion protein Ccz1/CCZ1-INTU-HSP4 n=1 Tax=Babesia duncani TaxID=323732 RepID=A0AAD9PKC9_9APIC|nr:bifunctional Vacuolar fusion protein Ccz1/CCZ1-INTU-HSP4 [Babesia duncani]